MNPAKKELTGVFKLGLCLFSTGILGTSVLGNPASPQIASGVLNPGDIIYVDSGNAIDGGFVIKVDPSTGEQTVIASGGYLSMPFGAVLDESGGIIVSDTSGRLIRVDPDTGHQTLIANNSRGTLGMPCGIALDRHGDLLVANAQALIRVAPGTGQIGIVSSGGNFLYPLGVADNSGLFVLNRAFPSQILWVNPQTGAQKVISEGQYLKSPQAIAVNGFDLYVTDVATPDGNFGIGRVIHVDVRTGIQTVVSEGESLVGPVGIAVDGNGDLIVGDPYTINPNSAESYHGGYDGGIIRIDLATRLQTPIVRGEGGHVNPRGVAIMPSNPDHKREPSISQTMPEARS